ncbi:MAG TPA: glycosyltransferase family 4 protein [Verrucomicrobiota bacterium]|nr:glycosyltransferase family 4 protein [Verrucomicrobiota bacterium]HRR65763.1 glycosyltransferase family 4 protein [Candidatus Paceibacterota bacterium]HNS70922.1 glycosyltransferase family 4 protein [Verrucomicrobiota bacterium]HOF72305.1 glycosyltransferase family 4 protein [Verrucomicrobiota bacterium]HOM46824.1 glycosyltransferase family 4 protein [Verrucomicrobiota bacterium]
MNRRSLRILALVPDAFGSHGGISKFSRDLLSALCAYPDCAEVVVLPRLMPAAPGTLPAKLTWITTGLGGKVRFTAAAMRCARRQPSAPLAGAAGRNSQPSSGFDLVICGHINLLPAAFLARRFVRRAPGSPNRGRCPLVLVMHGLDVWEPHRSVLVRSLARRVDAFVSVSAFTWDRFVRWSHVAAARQFVLPNCVDLSGFRPGEKDPVLLQKYGLAGRKVVMTLGRLFRERPKGIDEVMELLPELAREAPRLAYLIAGDGPDRPRLADKARFLGLSVLDCADSQAAIPSSPEPQVVFAGRVAESEKAAHYRLADAFVMPGYGEGFGIVYLEALACGIPVLASKLDASGEALRDGTMGLLVDPRNRDDLRRGLLQVLRQPRGQVPAGLTHFSHPNYVRRCHAIVDTLCPAAAADA